MRWKKIVTVAALVVVVLIATIYVVLLNLDFNRYKPQIAQLVFDATGRKLTIEGNIDVAVGIRPTLVAENVGLENAGWGSQPDLVRVKRLEAQLAFLPLIWGKLDFAQLVLIEPEVIVEFDSQGTSNFAFDTLSDEESSEKIPVPPLIFSDIQIEKGNFIFKDRQSQLRFSVHIDHLEGEIEGFDRPLHLDFKGAFNEIPLTLKGTVGPIWAWVEPGYSLPANLTATAGGATARIMGELRDPINIKNLAFDLTAEGSSVAEIARLAGLSGVPKLGAFNLKANLNDSSGNLAVEKLDIQIGSQDLVALSLTGDVKDVLAQQGVNLNFTAHGKDSAQLTQFGLPAIPLRGPYRVTAKIADPAAKVYTASDLSLVLDEHEVKGQLNLNLGEKIPVLSAALSSQKFEFGPFNLDFTMTGPVEKPAVKKINLKLGSSDLAEIRLNGAVDDLIKLQGVNINFKANGKDLANLEKLTGKPLPVRGTFSANGKVLVPVHKKLQIPDLKITAGKNHITGSVDLDLSGDRPQLAAKLSSPKLDLPSVLLPKLAKAGWAKGLGQVRPVKLDATLDGFAPELALKKVDLQAGTLKSAKLRLTGSVKNLVNLRGINLHFSLQGNAVTRLKEILAQPYLFAPVPGQGAYAISGKIRDPAASEFKVDDFKFTLADTTLAGRLGINLAGRPAQYEVDVSAPKFNLKPFPIPKEAAYASLNQIDDLGPLKVRSKVTVSSQGLSLQSIDLQAGSAQLAKVQLKGSIKNLSTQRGIDLNFKIEGTKAASLSKLTGQSVPLKGAYTISGKLSDPAQKKYRISDLLLKLGTNNLSGSMDLNLSGQPFHLAADFTAPKFNLQPVTLPALESLADINDLGPLKLAFKLSAAGQKNTLSDLDFKLGREDLIEVFLKGTISDLATIQGMKLEFSARGNDMSNFEKLGGPAIPFKGAFNVAARLSDPAPKVYRVESLNLTAGENNQTGWLELDMSAQRPNVKGELSSDKLDLRPLWPEDEKQNPQIAQPAEPASKKDKKSRGKGRSSQSKAAQAKVFSAKPFPLERLRVMDADLKFQNKQVLLPTLALDDVNLDFLLQDGNLRIQPFKFMIGGGSANVRFALRSQEQPAAWSTALDIQQLEIGPMLDKLGYQRSVEGYMDAAFNLDSTGESIAALMAGLNGNTRIAMSDGRVASGYLELLEKYLGSGILRMLNPFQEKREYTPVNCLVNTIEITDGLADIKILLDTDRTTIIGAGDVNLKTERLDLGIKPTPKKGAGPAGISFSFRELSQPFRLAGTLASPHLAIDPGRTAFVIGKMAGAVALGPVGIAAFFADVSAGKQDACAVALGATAVKGESSGEKKEEKKSGGFFRRLFRK